MKHHPRIHPVNYSLLRELSADHPAVRALQVHAEARDMCVGKEIDWPQDGIVGIDQVWWSDIDFKEKRFSSFAYQFISYDLYLDGWVEAAPEATEYELHFLDELPQLRQLLKECENAARSEKNDVMLPLIAKAGEFFDAFEAAIKFRFEQIGVAIE